MRIDAVDVLLFSCPIKDDAWTMAYGKGVKRDEVIIVVKTNEGITGIGESYHSFAPRAIKGIIETQFVPRLIGRDPLEVNTIWEELFFASIQLGSGAVAAISGVNVALWDVVGRSLGQPIYRLLGAGGVERVPAYVGVMALGWKRPEDLGEEALTYVSLGYKALKLRGGRGVREDVQAAGAVRKAAGEAVQIMIDGNSAYSWPEAVRLAKELEQLNVAWLEDPFDFTVAYHPQDMGALRRLSATPIASGGNVYTRFSARTLIDQGAVDYITPDVGKCGGLSEALQIAHLASAHNILVAPHATYGLNALANLHFTAAVPTHIRSYMEWDAAPDNPPRDEILTNPVRIEDGFLYLPEGPGLGTDLNYDAIASYPFIEGAEIDLQPRRRRPNI